MKKFKYRAESFLKFTKHQREGALKIYKDAQNFKLKLQERFLWMENEMKKAYEHNEKIGEDHRDVHFISDNNQFILMLKGQMQGLSQEIAAADEEIQLAYQELQKLQVKVKKLELHKESEEAKYKKERNKKIQKQIDEINSTRQEGRHAESV